MEIHFDVPTMLVVCSSLTIVSGLSMVLVQFSGKLYPGFKFWTIGVLGQAAVFTLFVKASVLPPVAFALLANALYTLYPTTWNLGVRAFASRRTRILPVVAVFLYEAAATVLLSRADVPTRWRVAASQLGVLPFFLNAGWIVYKDKAFDYRVLRPWIAAAFLLTAACSSLWLAQMFWPIPGTAGSGAGIQTAYMVARTGLSASLVIGVIVLNYKRAARDLKENEALLMADMAARRTAEEQLRESEGRYRSLIEHSPEAIVVHREGRIVFANPSSVRMFGAKSAEDLLGTEMLDRIHPDSRREAEERQHRTMQEGSEGPLVEMRYLRLDGTPFDVENQTARIHFDGEAALQVTAHEISELKRAAAERLVFERKLQETQRLESLGVLAGGIAHDFNNLLTGILGNASLALFELGEKSPAEESLCAIKQGAQRAADLCRQMLAYSGKATFNIRTLSLNGLVKETAGLLQISIAKNAQLDFCLDPALPLVEVDATQMRQVVMNLVINASDAIGDREGTIRLRTGTVRIEPGELGQSGFVAAQALTEGDYVFLEVADSGCGMAPETQARIFDPFFTTKFTGRGLGLAAVLGIVRGHKGAIRLSSELGRGTTFTVLLPPAAGPALEPSEEPRDEASWRGQGSILVVDDEDAVRKTAASMLKRMGYSVTIAGGGAEAVDVLRENPGRYEIVLMDLTMPRMDGKEAFARMRQIRSDVRLVLMSGFSEQEARSRFTGNDASGFLSKPFDFEELARAVRLATQAGGMQTGALPR